MGAEGLTPLMAEYQNRRPHPKSETTTPTHITAWLHGNWLATSPVHVSRCLGLVMLETSIPRYRHIPSANEDWESSLVEDWVEKRWSRAGLVPLGFYRRRATTQEPALARTEGALETVSPVSEPAHRHFHRPREDQLFPLQSANVGGTPSTRMITAWRPRPSPLRAGKRSPGGEPDPTWRASSRLPSPRLPASRPRPRGDVESAPHRTHRIRLHGAMSQPVRRDRTRVGMARTTPMCVQGKRFTPGP